MIKVSEIWRYPVKSMGGERIDAAALGERGLHADRMWAVRDPALGAISTARRLPPLLRCQARYAGDPVCAEPGDAPEVVITFPDGEEIPSSDPRVHARLSDLVGREVRLEPLPPVNEKERYRAPRETKASLRAHFGLADNEPLPDRPNGRRPMPTTVSEIWRYPVKSMAGERLDAAAMDERGMLADRMWAVRDPELGSLTTAKRQPALLTCSARYAAEPTASSISSEAAPEVIISLPGGLDISSADPDVHARLSELLETEVRLESIPPPTDKDAYRAPRETKAGLRAVFGLAEDEPLPDFSVFPLRKLAELSRYVSPVGSLYDAYPVHLITRASLATMAALAPGSDFDVRRFRPNIVVETEPGDGLPENAWCDADLDLPRAGLHGEIPTLRCVMPTREQRELATDPRAMRTVAKHANRCLGIYANVSRPGVVTVGDGIVIRAPAAPPRPVAMARAGAHNVKRGILRAANAMMPKE